MNPNKIVLHYKDARIAKGSTRDFFPNKRTFHLIHADGNNENIDIEDLKAVFFVKHADGDKQYNYKYEDNVAGAGKKVKVVFKDNETIIGYVLGYSPQRQGFFITPADISGNNERIYVVTSSVQSVESI
jgi:hypothetical protein